MRDEELELTAPWPWLPHADLERPPNRRCTWVVGPAGSGASSVLRILKAHANRAGRQCTVIDDLADHDEHEVLRAIAAASTASPLCVSSEPDSEIPDSVLRALRGVGAEIRKIPALTAQQIAEYVSSRWGASMERYTANRLGRLSVGSVGVLRAIVDDAADAGAMTARAGTLRLRGGFPLSHASFYVRKARFVRPLEAKSFDLVAVAGAVDYDVLRTLVDESAIDALFGTGVLRVDDSGAVCCADELLVHHRLWEMGPGLRKLRLDQVRQTAAAAFADGRQVGLPPDLPGDSPLLGGPWPADTEGAIAIETLVGDGRCPNGMRDWSGDRDRGGGGDTAREVHDLVTATLVGDAAGRRDAALALADLSAVDPRIGSVAGYYEVYGMAMDGEILAARTLCDELQERWCHVPRMSAIVDLTTGVVDLAEGRLTDGLQRYRTAVAEFATEPDGGWIVLALGGLSYASSLMDDEAARTLVRQLLPEIKGTWGLLTPSVQIAAAWSRGPGGAPEVPDGLAAAFEVARGLGQSAIALMIARELLRVGGAEAAEKLGSGPVTGSQAESVLRYRRALIEKDPAELEGLAQDFLVMGNKVFALAAYARLAHVYRRLERPSSARQAAATARELALECGGVEIAPLQLLSDFERLTARERQVGGLVAQGRTNKEIAEHVGLSVRTVEGHVMRACRRLGVANRCELGSVVLKMHNQVFGDPALRAGGQPDLQPS